MFFNSILFSNVFPSIHIYCNDIRDFVTALLLRQLQWLIVLILKEEIVNKMFTHFTDKFFPINLLQNT